MQQQREKRTLLPPPEPMFPKAAATPPVVNQGWWRVCTLLLLSTAAAATVVFTPGRIPSLGLNNDDFSLDKWATAEAKVAWNHILANIGPAAGAWDGIVIASPSTGQNNEPDYFVRV